MFKGGIIVPQVLDVITRYENIILWVPTILFALIVVLGFLFGLWRGFRSSLIRLVIMLISVTIAVVAFELLVSDDGKFIYSVGQPFFGESADGTLLGVMRLKILEAAAQQAGGVENIMVEVYPQIEVGAQMALRAVVFAICLVLYLLLLLVFNIFYWIFFSEGKYRRKCERLEKPYRKRRLLGGAIGLLRGSIAGLVMLSFVGLTLFSVTGGRKPGEEVTFEDDQIGGLYDVNNIVRGLGDTGILKILNGFGNKDDVPYYLFFANSIFSGTTVDYDGNEYEVYLGEQFASITGLANDLMDLFFKYGGEEIIATNNDSEATLAALEKLFNNEDFKTELQAIISNYQSTAYIKNLVKITIGAVSKSFDEIISSNLNEETANFVINFYDSVFKDDNGNMIIAPEEIVTFEDCKTLLNSVIDVTGDLFGIVQYVDEGIKTLDRQVTLLNSGLQVTQKFYNGIDELSFLGGGDEAKNTKMNHLVRQSVNFAFEMAVPDSTSPFVDSNINWFNELDAIVESTTSIVELTSIVIKESQAQSLTMDKALIKVFAEGYNGLYTQKDVDEHYDTLVDNVTDFASVKALMSSDFFYDLYSSLMGKLLKVESVAIPRNLVLTDRYEGDVLVEKSELRIVLENVRTLIGKGVLDFVNQDLSDVNQLKKLVNMLNSPIDVGSEITILEDILSSKLIYYSISSVLLNAENLGTEFEVITIPLSSTELIEGIKVVKQSEVVDLANVIPVVLEEIDSFEAIQEDPYSLIDIIKKEEIKAKVLESNIVTATASKYLAVNVLSTPELADMILLPSYLDFNNETADEVVLSNWMGADGEFSRLLNVLNYVDIKAFTGDNNMQAIKDLLGLEDNEIDVVLESDIIHFSFTKLLNKLNSPDFAVVIPGEAIDLNITDANGAKVIKNEEIHSIIVGANLIIDVDSQTNELIYDLDAVLPNKTILLESSIMHASLVNTIIINANKPELSASIKLPKAYQLENVNFEMFYESTWYINQEVDRVLEAFNVLEISLSSLVEGTFTANEVTKKILSLDEPYNSTTKIEQLCESDILSLTLTFNVMENEDLKGKVVVPNNALEVNADEEKFIKADEWLTLITGIKKAFDLTSEDDIVEVFKNINNNIHRLFPEDEVVYEAKKDALFASYILEASFINIINEELSKEDVANKLVLPVILSENDYQLWYVDRSSVTYQDGELGKLLDVFYMTGLGSDFANLATKIEEVLKVDNLLVVDGDTSEKIEEKLAKQATLLRSDIISATLIDTIVANLGSSLDIPQVLYECASSKEMIATNYSEDYLWNSSEELNNIFTSLNALMLPIEGNSVVFDINSVISGDYKASELCASKIIHNTITQKLLDTMLIFATSDFETYEGFAESYLKVEEFDNMLSSIKIFGEIDLANIQVANIFNEKYSYNRSLILKSNTLSLTMTKIIIESFASSNIFIPKELTYDFGDNKLVDVQDVILQNWLGDSTDTGIKELYYLFDVVYYFKIAKSIDNKEVSFNLKMIFEDGDVANKKTAVLNSIIFSANTTQFIYENQVLQQLVPNYSAYEAELTSMFAETINYVDTNWYKDGKLEAFLNRYGNNLI